jgi:L-iditol 2-dehydrogenase/threonine 3-dehydrogenase
MRQAVMVSPGVIEHRQVAEPEPGPGQALLRIRRIGICGSDVHVYHGRHPFTKYPVVQGHEFMATVEALGPGVQGVAVGAKVTATPQEVCGECGPCRRGRYNVCERLKVRGFQAPGVAQDLFVTEADKLVPLPQSFTEEQGAFVEPAAVAAHASLRAGDLAGKNVVVLGAGPIGNFIAQACRCRGAARVLISDPSEYRLQIARQVGIDAVCNPTREPLSEATRRAFGDEGFEVAADAAGVGEALNAALAGIAKGGTVLVVAVYEERPPVNMALVSEHELSMLGSMMYRHEDYAQAVEWIGSGALQTEPLDSRHFPFEQYLEAYRYIEAQGDRCVKVFVDL